MNPVYAFWRRALHRLRSSSASQSGAFDLPSILVGVVVVGILTAGVLAAVFGVIPFAQDSGARQDLDATRTAQGVAKAKDGRFMDTAGLDDAGYAKARPRVAAATDAKGSCYVAVSRSATGKTFVATNTATSAVEISSSVDTSCVPDPVLDGLLNGVGDGRPVAASGIMISTWDTGIVPLDAPECTTITLPLAGAVDVSIDWGDGTPVEAVSSELPAHLYTGTPGLKTITIDGTFTGWVGQTWPSWSSKCITEVSRWDETGTSDVYAGFLDASNLTNVVRIPSTATDWSMLFTGAKAFNGDVSGWDTSKVTSMETMFAGASSFNRDLSRWDTSKVTGMAWMFQDASSFDQPLNSWKTARVTGLSSMFAGASRFNQDLSKWDTSSVTDMTGVFHSATSFQGDISSWKTENVQSMDDMFYASAFNGDISGWKTGSLKSTQAMFFGNSSFNGDLSQWNTANVTKMTDMFGGATSFNRDIGQWETSKVTTMRGMFMGASSFDQNISSWEVSMIAGEGDAGGAGYFSVGSSLRDAYKPNFR